MTSALNSMISGIPSHFLNNIQFMNSRRGTLGSMRRRWFLHGVVGSYMSSLVPTHRRWGPERRLDGKCGYWAPSPSSSTCRGCVRIAVVGFAVAVINSPRSRSTRR